MIVFIVIVSVALVGVLSVMNLVTKNSADPMVRKQSMAFAEAVLEEVMLKDLTDPDGTAVKESSRSAYDDVSDYDGVVIHGDETLGSATIAALSGYTAVVSVTANVNVGPSGNQLAMTKIQVTVTDPFNQTLTLVGYRAI